MVLFTDCLLVLERKGDDKFALKTQVMLKVCVFGRVGVCMVGVRAPVRVCVGVCAVSCSSEER